MSRLTIRLSEVEFRQLSQLRDLLAMKSDSETVRALIRLHHAASQAELAELQRLRKNRQVKALREGRYDDDGAPVVCVADEWPID